MKNLLSFLPMSAARRGSFRSKKSRLLSILTLMPVLMILSATPLFAQNRFYPKAINIEPGTSESIEFILENAADFYGFQANVTLPSGLSFAKNDAGKPDVTLNPERCDNSYQCVTNMVSGVLHLGVFSFANPQPAIQGTGGTVVSIRVDASEGFRGGTVKLTDIKFVDKNDKDVNLTNTSTFIGVLPVSITVTPDHVSLLKGIDGSDTANLTVIYEPDCEALVRDITWTSADEDIASITSGGLVAAVADEGSTVVTATTVNGKEATCQVEVSTPLEGLTLVPESITMEKGSTENFIVNILPPTASGVNIKWTTSNSTIASIGDIDPVKGETAGITAVRDGDAIITVKDGEFTSTSQVTVVTSPQSIEIAPVGDLYIAHPITMEATIYPADASKIFTDQFKWASSDESVATIDEFGNVMPLALGQTTITATCPTLTGQVVQTYVITVVPVTVESLTIDPTSVELWVNRTATVTATVLPEDAADKTIIWTSADPSIATVDENGVITAVALGETTVTATCQIHSAECKVTVVPTPAESIAVIPESAELLAGETLQLTLDVVPADADVTWSSSNPSIATVDETGKVTAIYKGVATITATSVNGKTATCEVTVLIPAVSIILDKSEMTMEKGSSSTIAATVDPIYTSDETIWTSSNEAIATVANGVVTALNAGETVITATCGNVKAICHVTVIISPTGILLDKELITKYVGETDKLTETVIPEDATDKTVTWKSSNESIVTVDQNGNIVAVALGEAVVTVTCGAYSAGCKVVVIPTPASRVDLDVTGAELRVGETVTLTPTVYPDDTTDKTVTWQSADETIATVDAFGVVTAMGLGEVLITASCGDANAQCKITVVRTPVTAITLTNTELLLKEGESSDINEIVYPANATDPSVTWTSADPSIASVDEYGNVTGITAGTTIVTATSVSDPDVKATCKVTVEAIIYEVTGIVISDTSISLIEEDTYQLSATVTPENATDKSITWESSDPSVATVSSSGLVTAISRGEATIIASSSNGLKARCHVTVIPKVIEAASISLSQTTMTLTEGDVSDLLAIVLPVDTTDPSVTWSSTSDDIATVTPAPDSKGVITAIKQGVATITATTVNGLQATCIVTVNPRIIAVEGISVNPTSLDMIVGDSEKLTATITPADATDQSKTWVSFDPAIATVDEQGNVVAVSAGTTTVVVSTSNGKSAECTVTVSKGEVPVESISLTNTELTMHVGDVTDITAIVIPDDATDKSLTWVIADEEIATVTPEGENKGIVSALKIGTTVITISANNGVQAFCTVYVIPIPVESISIKESLEMTVGDEETLIATITPDNASDKTVTWRSSAPEIASVDESGKVTAVAPGSAIIYASSSNGLTATCAVTVKKGIVDVESISLTNTEITIHEGEVIDIIAMVRPDDADDKSVTWQSADETIATVTPQGENKCLITGVKIGDTTITITATNGVTATCTVHVIPIQVESISIKESLEMTVGDEETLIATITPDNATDKTVTWRSSDSAIATVDETGTVTAIAPGSAIIYASSSNGLTATCHVTVQKGEVPVESISLTNTELTIRKGYTSDITAIIRPDDATDKTVTWTIADDNIASLTADDKDAIITGLELGTTVVTATSANGKTATCTIYVIPVAVEKITINKDNLDMIVGDEETLIATILPEDATDKTVTWRSADRTIATVDENGKVTAVGVGETIIYASASNGMSAECHVTVSKGEVAVESISLTNTELTIRKGYTSDITAIIRPDDATDKTVTWTIADDNIASLTADDKDAIITGLELGTTVVTATSANGKTATCTIYVIPVAVEKITINKDNLDMIVGEEETLIATILPEDATDKTVTWKSADKTIATVDENGKVTAVGVGQTIIYASASNGMSAECHVTVGKGEVAVESISLTNTELTIRKGYTSDITAIIRPDDATDKTVTWTIADDNIASLTADDKDAIITGLELGTTVVTATSANGKTATCTIYVIPVAVEKITINKDNLDMIVGEEETLIATILPEDATDKTVTWKSADKTIATVDENGKVTAVGVGETIIYASASNGMSAECHVTVGKGEVAVESISLTNTELTIRKGYTSDITAIIRPDDATDKTVTWTIADDNIASLTADDKDAIITGLELGTTVVTATSANGKTATCTIYVIPVAVEKITINKDNLDMIVGEEETLIATILPEDATDKTVTWRSADRTIATVDENGKVTAVGVGETIIYASASNGMSAECHVSVSKGEVAVESISLTNTELTIRKGYTSDITAIIRPDDATDKTVTWTIADDNIASLTADDKDAIITGLELGTTVVTATSANGKTATCTIYVIPVAVEKITINKDNLDMIVGEEETLIATILPEDATDKTVTWRSADRTIATVDENGKVTAVGVGETIIYASASNGMSAECHVTVSKGEVAVESISLTNTELHMIVGDITDVTAIVLPEDATDKTISWSSADSDIASVTPGENFKGIITANAEGITVVTVTTANGLQATCTVYVESNIVPVAGISINKTSLDMIVGDVEDLIATITPADATDKTVTWKSLDPSIASVDANGNVTAVSVGVTTIYASASNGMSAECVVTVSKGEVPVESISLTNSEITMFVGDVTDIIALVRPDDATDKTVTWQSADETIATVTAEGDNKGIIKALQIGETVITITATNGVQATCTVHVIPIQVTSISIKESLDMLVGDEETLVATIKPDNATDKSVTWRSSDRSIATVDENGKVTGIAPGVATIYASSSNGLTATCQVTVGKGEVPVGSISLTNSDITMFVGDVTDIIALVRPDDATDKTVTWQSADETIATVTAEGDNKGIISALQIGETVITITATNGVQATCTVHVIPIQVTSISIKESLDMLVGDEETLVATIKPDNATDKSVTWRSSDRSIATVDENGKVTGIAPGVATIYASSSNGLTATCQVTVSKGEVPVESISLTNSEITMFVGDVTDIIALVRPDDATDKTVTWQSADETIATVTAEGDNKGIIKALQIGETVITITATNGVQATCAVHVIPIQVTSISIKESLDMLVGDEETLVATIKPDNATDKSVTWRSSDRSIATVDENGKVTGIAPGVATIYASSSNGLTATCQVTVSKGEVPVESISLTNSEITMFVGDVTDIIALVRPDDATDKTVTWQSADETIATITTEGDNKGIIKALQIGETVITITASNGVQATCTVHVIPIQVTSISIKESLDMLVGDEETLVATIKPDNATDKSVTWRSSDRSIATVDENGKVTGIAPGVATIYASSSNGLTATCQATVSKGEVPVESISLTNSEITMFVGDVTDIIALVRPDDATDKTVTWQSADETIATVTAEGDNKGIIKALQIGETVITITATNGVQATCTVHVIPIQVTSISIKESLDMLVGDEETLVATIKPDNATDKSVTWRSSDRSIATVDENGKVTGIAPGVATIYASSSNGLTATCQVTVSKGEVPVESISLTNTELTIRKGYTADITAIVLPYDASDKTVTWTIEDDRIVTLAVEENNAIITGCELGTTFITASSVNGKTAICKVTVIPVLVEKISLNKDKLDMFVGDEETLIATIEPENATDKTVTWRSADRTIAEVDENGKVTAVGVGVTTIYASASNGMSAECLVTVRKGDVPVESITLTNTELIMRVGHVTDIIAIVHPDDATDKSLTWTSDDESIVTVTPEGDDKGIISALQVGVTIVTARSVNGVQAICKVTVIPDHSHVESITLNKSKTQIVVGDSETLVATVLPEEATDKTVTWRSSNPAIASVSADGEVFALSVGVVTVYASTSNGLTAECEVTVIPGEVLPTGIMLTNTELLMREGFSTDITAIIMPSDATDKTITWTNTDEEIATIDPVNDKVIINALKQGVTIITASTVNNLRAICTVTVVPVVTPVESIEVLPPTLELREGDSDLLTAIITPDEATDKTVTWQSSDIAVATVSAQGEVTGISAGTAFIYASSSNGLTAHCIVTVIPNVIEVSAISVDPTEMSLLQGQTAIVNAIITPDDATDRSVSWTSADPAIASVENGVVTALLPGVTTITAQSANGLTAICRVTVIERPLTPKQLLRKGDGTTSTFVTLMPISNEELVEKGYSFVYGYTDPATNESAIIAETPLRYCQAPKDVYNNPDYDFWVFAVVEGPDGSVLCSNLRHLDGREEVCFDPSIYGYTGSQGSETDTEWIRVKQSKAYISAVADSPMRLTFFTTSGRLVLSKTYPGATQINDVIDLTHFRPQTYVVTLSGDGKLKSTKIVVQDK